MHNSLSIAVGSVDQDGCENEARISVYSQCIVLFSALTLLLISFQKKAKNEHSYLN